MTTSPTQRRMSMALIILAMLAAIAGLYWARPVLVPLAFAIFFSLLLMPLVDLLSRRIPRLLSAALATMLGLSVVGMLAYTVGKQLLALAESLPATMHELLARVHDLTPTSPAFGPIRKGLENMLQQFSAPQTVDVATAAPVVGARDALDVLATFVNPLASMSIICIMVLLILWDRDALIERLVRTFGRGELNVTTQALADVRARISRYLTAQLLSNVVFAAATYAGLSVLGIPNLFSWCLVTIFLRFVPYVGILLAASVPILLTVGQGWEVLYVIAIYAAVEAALIAIIEPVWLGQSAGISPLALVFSTIFWTFLWGLPGLFLATPLTVCLLMAGKHIPQLGFLNTLLSSESVMDPPARLYQRLLTLDPADAVAYVKQEMETNSVAAFADGALFPALRMAEVDRHQGRLSPLRVEKLNATFTQLARNWPAQFTAARDAALLSRFAVSNYDAQFLDAHAVVCVAASDQADQTASSLFHGILRSLAIPSTELSGDRLVGEAVAQIERSPARVVVLSSVPPFALTPVQYFLKRLRRHHSDIRVLVGHWGAKPGGSPAWQRADLGEHVEVATTLEQGLSIVHRWIAELAVENRPATPGIPARDSLRGERLSIAGN